MEQKALIERISSLETAAADQDSQLAAADRAAQRRLSESKKQAAAARALQRTTSAQDTLRSKLSQVEGELAAAKMYALSDFCTLKCMMSSDEAWSCFDQPQLGQVVQGIILGVRPISIKLDSGNASGHKYPHTRGKNFHSMSSNAGSLEHLQAGMLRDTCLRMWALHPKSASVQVLSNVSIS